MRNLLLALLLACGELGGEVGISSTWHKYHPNPQTLGTFWGVQVLAERCSFSTMPGVGLIYFKRRWGLLSPAKPQADAGDVVRMAKGCE